MSGRWEEDEGREGSGVHVFGEFFFEIFFQIFSGVMSFFRFLIFKTLENCVFPNGVEVCGVE